MASGIKDLARNLQSKGRYGDSILAHIMPEEAVMLKRMGGSGTINPKTGLLEFFGFSDFGGGMVSEGGSTGGVDYNDGGAGFGSQDVNAGGDYSGGSSGYGRDQIPSVGGSAIGGDGGRDFSSFGGGMVSSGAPMGGVNYSSPSIGGGGSSFGVPTIVSNAMGAVSNMLGLSMQGAQSAYQSLYAPFAPMATTIMQAIPGPESRPQNPYEGQPIVQGPDGGMYVQMSSGALLDPRSNSIKYPATFYSGTDTAAVYTDRAPSPFIVPPSPTMSDSEMAQNYRPAQYNFVPQTSQVASGMFGQPQTALSSFEPTQSFRQAASSFDTLSPTGIAGLPAPKPTTTLLADRLPNAPGASSEQQPTEVASFPQMSGTYEVSVEPLLKAYKKELGGYSYLTSDEDLYANAIKSITTSPEFIASGSTLTPSGELLENGLPSKVTVNALGADVMFALQQPRQVITDKNDPYYGTLTAYPSTRDVTTVSNLNVPLPPERPSEIRGETSIVQAPAPVQSFAELPNNLERTFQSLSGIPYDQASISRSVSMPYQDMSEVGSPQQYAFTPSSSIRPTVAQAPASPAPSPVSVPRPPVDIPPQVPSQIQIASILDDEFNRIVSSGDGRDATTRTSPSTSTRPTRDTEETIPPETTPPPPRFTTGMDLTRQAYVPSVPITTTSPAYS